MAWIEQTKKGSIRSGGPQYYLQDLNGNSRDFLGHRKTCPVRLWTPYGVVLSGLTAVSSRVGKVGHDRIQSGRRVPSVADQVASWFQLKVADIETIEFEDSFDGDCFVIKPSRVKFFGKERLLNVYPDMNPLTVTPSHRSTLIKDQIALLRREAKTDVEWIGAQIGGLVEEHEKGRMNVDECDLLRASGALSKLGIELGRYRGKGLDCPEATFHFDGFPGYRCPVEIEERSSGFLAAHHRLHRSQRVVVLCMSHDAPLVQRGYVDVIELRELGALLRRTA